ncbi:hypothetical protein B9Z55_003125 [Caenorhabditis nigoni]|uniref:Uncharacterized protein n=1 Tax=Caenorhabditis nigoni TaxID=1611254 RepID=A0A2G5VNR7_9PELO|nr:hypothetical protein B9Z55_003125 [Caenorhabditis nigoni]
MMKGIENFLNVRTPPQASISFEVIAEATCDPPAIKEKIVTEQPLKAGLHEDSLCFHDSEDLLLGANVTVAHKEGYSSRKDWKQTWLRRNNGESSLD